MNKRRRTISARAGMTLVEVMTATVLVALLALLMMTVFGASTNQMQEGRRISGGAAAGVAAVEQQIARQTPLADGAQTVDISFEIDGTPHTLHDAYYYESTQDDLTVYGFGFSNAGEVTP